MSRRHPMVAFLGALIIVAIILTGCSLVGPGSADAEDYFDDPRTVELISAASDGDVERVRALSEDGVDINGAGNDSDPRRVGLTPLHWAAEFMNPRTVTTLLEAGADPLETTANGGYNVMNYAILRDRPQAVEALLSWDPALADSPDRVGANALNTAVLHGREDIVDQLIDAGVDLDATATANGGTALHTAARVSAVDLCLTLVREGADAGIRDIHGNTFLRPLFRVDDAKRTQEFLSKRAQLVHELETRGFPVETGRD